MITRTMHIIILITCLLLSVSGVSGQEETPEPIPAETATDSPTPSPTEIPTEAATETPTDSPTVTLTETVTETPTETATAETTEGPISTPSETATVEASEPTAEVTPTATSIPAEPPLSLLLSDSFDGGDLSTWSLSAGWSLNEQMLQARDTTAGIQLADHIFYNVVAQTRFRLRAGSLQLLTRANGDLAYAVTVDTSGVVTLSRAGVPLQMAITLPVMPDTWREVRLATLDNTVRVSIDGVEILTWWDEAPLPPGAVAVKALPTSGTDSSVTLDMDDFTLWVPTAELHLYPTPTAVWTATPQPEPAIMEPALEGLAIAAPKPRQPGKSMATNDNTPTFNWDAVTSPTGSILYQLQVATNSNFRNQIINLTDHSTNTYTPDSGLPDRRYYWRVRAFENGVPGKWSGVWSFTVDTVAPPIPVLVGPADGGQIPNTRPKFSWKASSGASRYDVQLDFGNPPTQMLSVKTNSYTPPAPLLYTTYFWRVQAVDAAGNVSGWSEVRSITLTSANNAVPVLNRMTTGTPLLTWTPISWAQGYQIQVDDNRSFTSPAIYETPPSFTATIVSAALPNGVYYWRIRPKRDATRWGKWSSIGTFQVEN